MRNLQSDHQGSYYFCIDDTYYFYLLYRLNLFLVGTVLEQVEPVLVGTVPNRSAQGAAGP